MPQSMVFKVFLDANICLDFILQRKGFEIVDSIFERIVKGEVGGYVTPSIVHIISYYTKRVHSDEVLRQILLKFLTVVEVIDCNHEIAVTAIASGMLDVEDALQYYTAIHHKIDYFITHDKLFRKACLPNLPVLYPADFLALFYN